MDSSCVTKAPVVHAASVKDIVHLCMGSIVVLGFVAACPNNIQALAAYREFVVIVALALCWVCLSKQSPFIWRVPCGAPSKNPAASSSCSKPRLSASQGSHTVVQVGPRGGSECLHTRIHAATKSGDLALAEAIMRQAQGCGKRVDVRCYGALISSAARTGDLEAMEAWLEELIQSDVGGPNTILFNVMINACAKQADVSRAEYWLQRMAELAIEPDVVSFNAVIEAHALAADFAGAEAWLSGMSSWGVQPDARSYGWVLHACAQGNELGRAEVWFERMLDGGTELLGGADVDADASSFSAAVKACSQAGDIDRALAWVDRMQGLLQPTADTYDTLLRALCKLGDLSRAEQLLSHMAASGVALPKPADRRPPQALGS